MSEERTAWGWGLASVDAAGTTLDVWYPELNLGEAPAESDRPNHNFGTLAHDEADARGIRRVPVFVVSQLDEPISNAADAYLKLHLMSMRMAKPNTLNLDGIFAQLANVVWTNYGPFAVEDFNARKLDVEAAATSAARSFAASAGLPAAAPAAAAPAADKLKIAFMYVSPIGDGGWTFAHDNGRKEMEKALGDKVVTSFVESNSSLFRRFDGFIFFLKTADYSVHSI